MTVNDKKIIAEFMGFEIVDKYVDVYPPDSQKALPMLEYYFSDWNEVMPVANKCLNTNAPYDYHKVVEDALISADLSVETVLNAVLYFITHYKN